MVIGAGLALIPNLPVIQLLLAIQVGNGVLLPAILLFILLLINDERLAGALKNGPVTNMLGWSTLVLISVAVLVMLASLVSELVGLPLS